MLAALPHIIIYFNIDANEEEVRMRQTTFLMKIDATYYQSLVSAESFSMSSIIGHLPYRSSLLALDKVNDMLKLDKEDVVRDFFYPSYSISLRSRHIRAKQNLPDYGVCINKHAICHLLAFK